MGQKWTPEQKAAAKARWAERKNKNPETKNDSTINPVIEAAEQQDLMSGPQPGSVPDIQNVDVGELLKRIQELEAAQWRAQVPQQAQQQIPRGMSVGPNGSLVGTREKYILDPKRYPDPCVRLAVESRLSRFAFKENYDLRFTVAVTQYQTKDGVNTKEPKFTLELIRVMFDEDTGLPTNQRYVVCQAIFHEDPEAALIIARDNGVDVDAFEEETFLDEMRYLRMRDWLLEAFYPPKRQTKKNKKEMVIGNRVVEVYEINSESSETMPFADLKKKL
jgi:hypothetical protein